jgi:hypothetical protein
MQPEIWSCFKRQVNLLQPYVANEAKLHVSKVNWIDDAWNTRLTPGKYLLLPVLELEQGNATVPASGKQQRKPRSKRCEAGGAPAAAKVPPLIQ